MTGIGALDYFRQAADIRLERANNRYYLAQAGLNVALNVVLIPAFGPLGAALATGTSIVFSSVLLLLSVVRKLNIDPTVLGWIRP